MDEKTRSLVRKGGYRLLFLTVISVLLVFAGSEIAFFFQKENTDRAPEVIELTIPEGTSAQIASGQTVQSIPDSMVFVVGDVLVVKNNDTSDHQLGPLWIPAKSSASLDMSKADNYAYTCSFQPGNYLGLDVRPPTTVWTRMQAMLLAAPATAVFLFVYSLLVFPLDGKKKGSKESNEKLVRG